MDNTKQQILDRMASMNRGELLGLWLLITWYQTRTRLNRLYSSTAGKVLALALLAILAALTWQAVQP